jgi:chorismate synthase
MLDEIKAAKREGCSLGGVAEVLVGGVPPGLGSYAEWDRRLEAKLAAAMMGIPSVKAVEIGDGIAGAARRGPEAHDDMRLEDGRVVRDTNHAGGIEGGMTNGETITVRLYSKPIPTTPRRSRTFDMKTRRAADAPHVRSDVCVVPALSVIAESAAAWDVFGTLLEKFGGDHIDDTLAAFERYRQNVEERLRS